MKTYIYVDGFNLYYRALINSPYKWLDLKALFTQLLQPHHVILKIKYFTARVSGTPSDPNKPIRQVSYISALEAFTPEVEIYYGHFLTHSKRARLVRPTPRQRYAYVIKTEEKGSDVNLAAHLITDAWLNVYDCAVVVSNDGDLAQAMRLMKQHHNKTLGLVTPGTKTKPSPELAKHANFCKRIRTGVLRSSQLPDPIPGTKIHKPLEW